MPRAGKSGKGQRLFPAYPQRFSGITRRGNQKKRRRLAESY